LKQRIERSVRAAGKRQLLSIRIKRKVLRGDIPGRARLNGAHRGGICFHRIAPDVAGHTVVPKRLAFDLNRKALPLAFGSNAPFDQMCLM